MGISGGSLMSAKQQPSAAGSARRHIQWSETVILRAVGGLETLVGILMLAAWALSAAWVETVFSPGWTIRPNTAFGFVLIGVAILLQTVRGSGASAAKRFALALSAAAGAIAVLTLLEHGLGIDLRSDVLLGEHVYVRWTAQSGRMGVNSAACLLLSSASALFLGCPAHKDANNAVLAWFSAFNAVISIAALGAHIEAARAGYNWMNMISMSVPAAMLYAIKGVTFVCVAARRAGFRWALGRGLTFEFAGGLAILFGVVVMVYLSAMKFGEATDEIRRSGQVLGKISALRRMVDEIDSAIHSAMESGVPDSHWLSDKHVAMKPGQLLELHADLNSSVHGSLEQEGYVAQLREALERWSESQREAMARLKTQGREAALYQLVKPDAQRHRAQVYGLLMAVGDQERQHLSTSERRLYKELERTFGLLPLGALVGTLVLSYGVIRLSIEMDRREQVSKVLQLTEARQRLAVEAAGIGDWELNPATHVMTRSARLDQIFGYSEPLPEWGYETFLEHVHPEDRARVDSLYRQSIEEGRDWTMECRIRRKDGTAGWIWWRGRCFKNELGLVESVRGVVGDVTERRAAEEEIRSLNASLEQRVRERTEKLELTVKELDAFTYSVSHDLRAPLRAIDGFSKLVIEDHSAQLPEEARRKLAVVSSEAQRMSRLIDDLLSFSRLGRAQVHPEQIDMQALAKEVFAELQELRADTRKIDFKVHPMPAAMGTQPMVRQVWTNLIGNALKFTRGRERAQIEIGCRSNPQGENAYYIKDNGVGFDMRHAGKLFGVFQRLHSDKEFEGSGAGLALVQRIVNRHGGKVWADAAPDEGATFFFTLPTPNV